MEPRCKRRFEYVKVVPLSRYSTVLRALFRDDQVVMQPTMITLPSLFFFFFFFSLWPQAPFPNDPFSFLSQVILSDTWVPPLHLFAYKTEPPHTHCVHRLFTGYEPRRFISGKKSSLFVILPCAIGLFNHRQTAMYRGRRSV